MQNQSWNINRQRVLYELVDIIGKGCEAVGEGGKSLHDLHRIYHGMLMEVM